MLKKPIKTKKTMSKSVTIVKAAPCAGKTTIKTFLEGFDVTCVDMSDAIRWASGNDPELDSLAKELALKHELLSCDRVMSIFVNYLTQNLCDKIVVFGAPRTERQAIEIANHDIFIGFDALRVLDVTVDVPVIEKRFYKRQSQGGRLDDNVSWPIFKKNRVDPFHDSRHPILKVFNHHDRWHVGCANGDAENAASDIASHLVTSMHLHPRLQMVHDRPHGKRHVSVDRHNHGAWSLGD
jgi:adenylate kinase family enzyme